MPRIKAFLVLTILVAFSFSLFGCGLISGLTSGPEEVMTGQEGELPEWLLLAHRSDENTVIDSDDDADPDDDSGTLTPPPPQETTAPATTTPAPAPAPTPAPAPEPEPEYADPTTPTGSMEVRQAKNALDKIAKELNDDYKVYDFGFDLSTLDQEDQDRIKELIGRAAKIDNALRTKYGIVYVPDLGGGGGFGDTWSPFN